MLPTVHVHPPECESTPSGDACLVLIVAMAVVRTGSLDIASRLVAASRMTIFLVDRKPVVESFLAIQSPQVSFLTKSGLFVLRFCRVVGAA